jgi:hypothetical protein
VNRDGCAIAAGFRQSIGAPHYRSERGSPWPGLGPSVKALPTRADARIRTGDPFITRGTGYSAMLPSAPRWQPQRALVGAPENVRRTEPVRDPHVAERENR